MKWNWQQWPWTEIAPRTVEVINERDAQRWMVEADRLRREMVSVRAEAQQEIDKTRIRYEVALRERTRGVPTWFWAV